MKPVWGHRQVVEPFVARMIPGCERGFGACEAMGIIDDAGRLIAGVVYHDYDPESGVIQLSAASLDKRWLTRPILREMFGYPYDFLGCQMTVFRVHPENWPMRRMLRAIGGTEYEIPRLRGRDTSEIIITVADDAWRSGRYARERNA